MLRSPKSIPSSDTIIEDPKIEPFFIVKSSTGGGYVIYERVIVGESQKAYIKTHAYPGTFNSALKIVSRKLLNQADNKHFSSIKEYIQTFEDLVEKMKTITEL